MKSPLRAPFRRQDGFTLVEMMVVISVLGIALAMAIPSFRGQMERARFDRAAAEMQSDLRLAISTAKATGRAVLIDFETNGYRLVDATDSTRVYRERTFDGGINLATSGDPLVFPWGMVQPADVNIASHSRTKDVQILPTGRLEVQ